MSPFILVLIAAICFVLGMVAGAFINMRFSAEQQKSKELEKHLHDKQEEFKDYQLEVTQHFTETARLLKQMAESYRDVHNHLATGANDLCDDKGKPPIMQTLPEMDEIINDEDVNMTAPLDYAPRSTPFDKGTLNEDYGLEKVELSEKPIEDIAEVIAENAKSSN